MPSKRRPRLRHVQSQRIALWPDLIAVLLQGWAAPRPDPDPDDTAFDIFFLSDLDLAHAWRQHRAYLLAEHRRRGLAGRPWAARFDEGGDA